MVSSCNVLHISRLCKKVAAVDHSAWLIASRSAAWSLSYERCTQNVSRIFFDILVDNYTLYLTCRSWSIRFHGQLLGYRARTASRNPTHGYADIANAPDLRAGLHYHEVVLVQDFLLMLATNVFRPGVQNWSYCVMQRECTIRGSATFFFNYIWFVLRVYSLSASFIAGCCRAE